MLFFARLQLFLAENFGVTPKLTPGWVRKFHYYWSTSSARAEKELGYTYSSLAAGISETLAWLNQKPSSKLRT